MLNQLIIGTAMKFVSFQIQLLVSSDSLFNVGYLVD